MRHQLARICRQSLTAEAEKDKCCFSDVAKDAWRPGCHTAAALHLRQSASHGERLCIPVKVLVCVSLTG